MSKQQQVKKNLIMAQKLADYLVENPNFDTTNQAVSYVFFSATDTDLNKANLKLVKSLVKEGKNVVKAEETKDKHNPWNLIPLTL